MDYKDLANLIFPNVKEISYYEEKYPERTLPEGAVVTRYAPSPTGVMHIGGLYQAIIDYLLAKNSKGIFFLRNEDTDKVRELDGALKLILNTLFQHTEIIIPRNIISAFFYLFQYGIYQQKGF